MECDKCGLNFQEKELDLSHDIPKYMGGTDKDGRHWLCRKCHKEYELEVMVLCWMNFVKNMPEKEKEKFRYFAKIVQNYFFKNRGGENGNP